MSMFGKYSKVKIDGSFVEQNGLDGAPKAWPTTDCSQDVRLTSQAPREEVDINSIVKRMESGKMVDSRILREGVYEDVSGIGDLADCIMKVQQAKEDFMELPANVRERFRNDPVELVKFLEDEGNRAEAVKLGLIVDKPKAGEPASIPPVTGESKAEGEFKAEKAAAQ